MQRGVNQASFFIYKKDLPYTTFPNLKMRMRISPNTILWVLGEPTKGEERVV